MKTPQLAHADPRWVENSGDRWFKSALGFGRTGLECRWLSVRPLLRSARPHYPLFRNKFYLRVL